MAGDIENLRHESPTATPRLRMSPRAFLASSASNPLVRSFQRARRVPLRVEGGETVGVVMMNLGGPSTPDEVEPFVYSRLMDPTEVRRSIPRLLRHYFSAFAARRRSKSLGEAYAQIGGHSPLARHTGEQAIELERSLNDRFGALTGATFKTYVAMRHSHPSSEAAAAQMAADGVTKVVFLPLHPHYSGSTTGSSLAYWTALEEAGEIPVWESSAIPEYAAHPKYIRALADRVDEGLQRFPREVRDDVQVVFSAHGGLRSGLSPQDDPYCCHVHATVSHLLAERAISDPGRGTRVAFQTPLVGGSGLDPFLCDTLEELADQGHSAVLVVPVSFVSDRVETAYELDVRVRAKAKTFGISHFEVSSGLNCHPLFVDGLADCVGSLLTPLDGSRGDGAAPLAADLASPLLQVRTVALSVRCATCDHVVELCDWGLVAERVDDTDVTEVPVRSDDRA